MSQEKYLQGRKDRMQQILREASIVADAMSAATQGTKQLAPGAVLPGVEDLDSWGVDHNGNPPDLSVLVRTLDERLMNAMQETVMNMNTIFLQVRNSSKVAGGHGDPPACDTGM